MANTKYSEEAEIIKRNIHDKKVSDLEINGFLWSFLMVSSSLSTFMPKLKAKDHYKMVQNMQFHRSLSGIDILYPSLLENTKIYDKSNVIEQSYNKAHIFVGYHAGCYNMFLRCMAEKNVPFCVVANHDYISKFEDTVQELYKDIPDRGFNALEIFPAEDPKLLLKLTKQLSAGISVFIFIDGNSGTKQNDFSNDKNLLKIDFLNHHIYARQGVAFLAYLSKAPIATLVAKRDKKLNNIVKINLIKTEDLIAKHNRNDFVNLITKKIYKELETYLAKNYEQWAGWFYIHNFFDTDVLPEEANHTKPIKYEDAKFVVNDFIHLIKHDEDNIFLVMKTKYEIMRIGDFLFDVLTYFKTPRTISEEPILIGDEVVGLEFLEELIEMNFLRSAP